MITSSGSPDSASADDLSLVVKTNHSTLSYWLSAVSVARSKTGGQDNNMGTLIENFRVNLRRIREEHGLSQEELSYECDLDRTYIGKIERGERTPSLETIDLICEVLGRDCTEFFGDPGTVSV